MKNIIFGDTGGHYFPFVGALKTIGVNLETYTIPEDITIIHLGDLIHKGIGSNRLVALVDKLITNNEGRYIQIFGNHELQHIKGAPYFWRCDCSPETIETLNRWFKNKQAKIVHAIPAPNKFYLPKSLKLTPEQTKEIEQKGLILSHGGIVYDFWSVYLNKEKNVNKIEKIVDNLHFKPVSAPGLMLGVSQTIAGPVWAAAALEVYKSWNQRTHIPFNQVNGHSPAWNFMRNNWFPSTPKDFRRETKLDIDNRVSYTKVSDGLQLCCDPGWSFDYDIPVQTFLTVETPE